MAIQALMVFSAFIVLSLLGLPIFLGMGITGLFGLFLMHGSLALAIQNAALITWEVTSGFTFLAIALFVFSGTLMQQTGISRDLFNFANAIVGGIRNGLGIGVIIAAAIFSAISGSSSATAAALGVVALPVLSKQGYSESVRGGILCAGGTLGIMIPPSITMILYGAITETSVGQLFMAGVFPGILLTILYSIYLLFFARPGIKGQKSSLKHKCVAMRRSLWALSMPLIVLGGIYLGLATPTEIGAISCVYAIFIGAVVYRSLGFKELKTAAMDAVGATTMIMMLVACGLTMARYLTLSQVPQVIGSMVQMLNIGQFGFISLMLVIYFLLGMVLEPASMMLITIPVFFPITQSLGINPLYFGIFVVISNEFAMITPPVGLNLYIISGIGKIPIEKLIVAVIPYIICILIALYIITLVPSLYLALPNAMMK